MNYLLKNSPRGNRYKKPAGIVAVVIVFLILFRLAVPSLFDSFFGFFFAPLWRMEGAVSADDFFATHGVLVAENTQLQSQLDALAPAQSSIALLTQENAELKAMLGRSTSLPGLTLSAVLKTPPAADYDSLIIDIGSDQGVQTGDRVFALASPAAGPDFTDATSSIDIASTTTITEVISSSTPGQVLMPIGTIAETSAGTSKVSLFSSPGQKYSVEIGPDHIAADATAQGGGNFDAELAQGSNVQVGDPVTIPDILTLTFGSVGAIVNDPTHPYMSVLFQEPVNIYGLRWVLVEKGNKQ